MSGFIDNKENVMEILLTQHGRKLLSEGKLIAKYYRFFDDEVNYKISEYYSGTYTPPSRYLLDSDSGYFSRYTEAFTYQWSWSPIDTKRSINDSVLVEGSPTYMLSSRSFVGWNAGTAALTTNDADGPDGEILASSRLNAASGEYGPYLLPGTGPSAASFFVRRRAGAGAGTNQAYFGTGAAADVSIESISENWQLIEMFSLVTGGNVFLPVDSRALTPPMTTLAQDLNIDLVCVETVGRYPTSSTRTSVRGCDDWQWATAEVPERLRSGKFSMRITFPWSSANLISGDVRVIMSFGDSDNVLRIRHTGADIRIEVVVGGAVLASTSAVSWTATRMNMSENTLIVDGPSARLGFNGVFGAVGTSWIWPAAPFRLGGIWGGGSEVDSYVAIPEIEQ
jgi:hypothetical protein